MQEKVKVEGMLSPYRVLDLTDEKGLLCGKILGDLGADVIKIERPGGDPARNIGPFYHDEIDPEKSLFWWAFNTSKRGITLDIETTEGQETFKRLVKTADFVIESFPPGYMDRLGLGYQVLEKVNPGVIMVSVSPFGQTGPYKDCKGPDIVVWAMGGQMYPCGDEDRAPVRLSHHFQAYLHAAGEAAAGAMMAFYHREMTGEGQHVDISVQELVAQDSYMPTSGWDMNQRIFQRGGTGVLGITMRVTRIWPCKDGHVMWAFSGGFGGAARNDPFVEWMDSEGIADDYIKEIDWETFGLTVDDGTEDTLEERALRMQEVIDKIEVPTGKFFLKHTKAELYDGSMERRIILYPIYTAEDILASVQLDARQYWVELEHPELGTTIAYPGAFAQLSEASPRVSRRPPLIGEHNQEVLEKELPALEQVRSASAQPRQRSERQGKKLLEGIKVVDFTWNIVGPLTTKTLADYGAEVIRLEHESRPDPARALAFPFKDDLPGLNRSHIFNKWNTNKLSVALNLADPRGIEIARRFIARADIVIETFAGGVLAKMGLGYEEIKKIKPDIIMLSSCMMGQTGPHATHPGYGWNLGALSGYFHITGWPDRTPVAPDGPYTDFIAPRFSIPTILAALDYRRRTGQGQFIDLSQYETGIHFLAPLILDYAINKRVGNRMGNRSVFAAPHGAFCCRGEDRWCAVAVFTDEEWQSFCQVIGNPAWTGDPRFATLQSRQENEDELERLVETWTINRSAEEVMTVMQAAGVGAGVLQNGEDMLELDPQLRHRRSFREVDHPEIGKYRPPRTSFILSKVPCELRPAPLLGEHSEYALKEFLGMTDEEIVELVVGGIIG